MGPLFVDQGLGVMVWSPLAGGLLSGKYRRGQQASEGRHLGDWNEPPVRDEDRLYDSIEILVKIADGHGASAAQVALAYLITKPSVSMLVIGARKDAQLADNLAAAELTLGAEEIEHLDRASEPALIYPHRHQARTAADRFGPADRALHGPATRSLTARLDHAARPPGTARLPTPASGAFG